MFVKRPIRVAVCVLGALLCLMTAPSMAQVGKGPDLDRVLSDYAARKLKDKGLTEQTQARRILWNDDGGGERAIIDMQFEKEGAEAELAPHRQALIASQEGNNWEISESDLEGNYYIQSFKMGDLYLVRLPEQDVDFSSRDRIIERWHLDDKGKLTLIKSMSEQDNEAPPPPKSNNSWLHYPDK